MADDRGCPFCAIAAGAMSARVVYEDPHAIAFIDLRQPSAGHTLVVPRRHIRNVYELDDATAGPLMRAVAHVSRGVRDALACEGMSHWISTDAAGGQEVDHLHVHIMPRHAGDGLLRKYPARPPAPSQEELAQQAAAIRDALASVPPASEG